MVSDTSAQADNLSQEKMLTRVMSRQGFFFEALQDRGRGLLTSNRAIRCFRVAALLMPPPPPDGRFQCTFQPTIYRQTVFTA